MNWQDHYRAYATAQLQPGDAAFRALEVARRRVAENRPDDWTWLESALEDREARWFVARVFAKQPVPKRLLPAFIRAAVTDADASQCAQFVKPCVRSHGRTAVATALLRYLEEGTPDQQDGAEKAIYWCGDIDGTPDQQGAFRARVRLAIQSAVLERGK